MAVYDTVYLMISFGMLIVAILSFHNKK
ncbi:putative holin-like toxin [Oceanobacillus zhaokaii]